jgi:succinate dehydrogenase/fumarate reductase flavoprotein subunit
MTSNQYDVIIIGGGVSGAKVRCSAHGSPAGLRKESAFSQLPRTEAGL